MSWMAGSSPRPWGCFPYCQARADAKRVFPTPVGVFLYCKLVGPHSPSLPHARGGVSHEAFRLLPGQTSSPRPWGCFFGAQKSPRRRGVFPTPVGVFLILCCGLSVRFGLPHARGGVSAARGYREKALPSSPRPWGCFQILCKLVTAARSLPHARGGVSGSTGVGTSNLESSPRPWGCFHHTSKPWRN